MQAGLEEPIVENPIPKREINSTVPKSRRSADHALVVGNPGRVTGWMCQCGVKLLVKGKKASYPKSEKHYLSGKAGMKGIQYTTKDISLEFHYST
jgi:hypothetical protein